MELHKPGGRFQSLTTREKDYNPEGRSGTRREKHTAGMPNDGRIGFAGGKGTKIWGPQTPKKHRTPEGSLVPKAQLM